MSKTILAHKSHKKQLVLTLTKPLKKYKTYVILYPYYFPRFGKVFHFFLFSIKVFTQLSIYKVVYYFIFNCDIKKNREMTRLEYSNIYLYIFGRNCTPETIMQPG